MSCGGSCIALLANRWDSHHKPLGHPSIPLPPICHRVLLAHIPTGCMSLRVSEHILEG